MVAVVVNVLEHGPMVHWVRTAIREGQFNLRHVKYINEVKYLTHLQEWPGPRGREGQLGRAQSKTHLEARDDTWSPPPCLSWNPRLVRSGGRKKWWEKVIKQPECGDISYHNLIWHRYRYAIFFHENIFPNFKNYNWGLLKISLEFTQTVTKIVQ